MSEQTGKYTIEIGTKATGDGAAKTTADINKLGEATKATGDRLKLDLGPDAFKIPPIPPEVPKAVDDLSEKVKEGGKHVRMFGEEHETAHAAVRALGEALPGVGQLAREMFSPETLGIGILVLGFEMLGEHFRNLAEQQQAFLNSAAKGVGSMLREQAGAASEAATETQKLADNLANAATGENSMLTAMSNRIALFDNYIAGLKKVEQAEDQAEEARIKRAEREGKISPEQAEDKLKAIHDKAESRDTAHADESAQFKLDQERQALAKAQADLPALAKAKKEADAKVQAAETAKKNADTKAGTGEGSEADQLKVLQDELDKKIKEADEAKRRRDMVTGHAGVGDVGGDTIPGSMGAMVKDALGGMTREFTGYGSEANVKKADEEANAAAAARDQAAKAVKEAKAEQARKAAELQAAQDAAEKVNKQYEDANKVVTDYGGYEGKVSVDAAKLEQDRAAAAAVAKIKAQQAAENAGAQAQEQAGLDPEANRIHDRAQTVLTAVRNTPRGAMLSREEGEQLKQLVQEMTEELAKFTHLGLSDTHHFADQIREMKRDIEDLSSRIRSNGVGY